MPYLKSGTVKQTRIGQNSGTIRVEWVFGTLIPDVIQVGKPVIGNKLSELYAEVKIDKATKSPTFCEFDVIAPQLSLPLVIAPRTVENGEYTELMPDDEGVKHNWYTFQFPLPALTVAASPSGNTGLAKPNAPVITAMTVEDGVLTVQWTSPQVDHFNMTLVPSIVPFQGQIELSGSDRTFVQTHVTGNRSYRFSIQGCHVPTIGKHKCSDWATQEIWVPFEKGFQSWRRWFMVRPETAPFEKIDKIAPKQMPQLKSEVDLSTIKPVSSGIVGELVQKQMQELKQEINPAFLQETTTWQNQQVTPWVSRGS